MNLIRKTINGLNVVMEKQELAPNVFCFMVSLQSEPMVYPMVYKKEYGGWIFVDKMTLLELKEIEAIISKTIEEYSISSGL